ncbi:MAG: hypothetical protein K9H25_01685 [Rhodospirillum sp.]|nr:hypothetical protein [Rhodospirillum sp.]MCF8488157.1 hypothetical protein [Rhodospirillum sp.]MCF8503022.1 hypothetical protein [Rhodospirillum sp.]
MYHRAPGKTQLPPELCGPFAHRILWRERARFLQLAGPSGIVVGTVIILEALGWAEPMFAPHPGLAAVVVVLAVIPIHVGWTRFLLLKPPEEDQGTPAQNWPRPRFGRRELAVALVLALLVGASVAYGFVVGALAQWVAYYSPPLVALLGFLAVLPAALLLTRAGLVPTCLALDMAPTAKEVARLGRGHIWALLAAVIGCLLVDGVFVVVAATAAGFAGTLLFGGLGTMTGPPNPVPGLIGMGLVVTLAVLYGAGLLASLFAHALAWSQGRELTA